MRLSLATALLAFVGLVPDAARAGAWTLDHGQVQIISGVTVSRASRTFNDARSSGRRVLFEKLLVQNWMEYGLTDSVTLFAAPECVTATSGVAGQGMTRARDAAVEVGARILLLTHFGMLSIQGSGKTAGAFDMSVSAGEAAGSQVELRLLYGRNFRLIGRDGFIDLQVAERWIRRPRPNEMTIDATAGLRLRPATLVMFQSFNTISGGGGQVPYSFYRVHKLELSVVERITPRWSLQLGAFVSPAGQNTIVEQGFNMSIWVRF